MVRTSAPSGGGPPCWPPPGTTRTSGTPSHRTRRWSATDPADTVIWTTNGPHGPIGQAYGDADLAIDLIARAPEFDGLNRLNLPRAAGRPAGRPAGWAGADWDFRWAAAPPPAHPDEARVVALTDADHDGAGRADRRRLSDQHRPTGRPGRRRLVRRPRRRPAGGLGADRSRGDVGFIGGLAVAPTSAVGGWARR